METSNRSIALFSASLHGGGAERVLVNLAQGMANLGCAIDVVLVQATGQHMGRVAEVATIIDLKSRRTLSSVGGLARYMRRRRPRAIICFQDHASVVALWARGLARTSIPIVATIHSTWSQVMLRGNLKTQVLAQCTRRAYLRVESIVAVSEGAAADLAQTLRLPRSIVKVIYNPIISAEMFEKAKESFDHPWFAPGQPPVLLGIGRLAPEKDFPTLVLAFEKVRRHMPCRLMILGEGKDLMALQRIVNSAGLSDDVAFPGFVENPYKYMARSSLFVLSSLWEGLPTVLIEALALGVPVVSTDCESGPREILEGGRYGQLVQPGDANALAAAISQALLNKQPSFNGTERFDRKFISEQYLSLIDQVSN